MKKAFAILLIGIATLFLTSCGGDSGTHDSTQEVQIPSQEEAQEVQIPSQEEAQEEAGTIPDLTGEWKSNGNTGTYQGAYITEDTIEVYWVIEEEGEDTVALYWAGSYMPPSSAQEPYIWTSVNDTAKTSGALLASGDDTKEFVFQDGTISYPVTFQGETTTVELEKEAWGYGERSNSNILVDAIFNGGVTSEAGKTMVGSGDLGDYHVEIKGASLAQDWDGETAIIVTYAWTNNSEDTTSAMTSMYEKAFQDGIELDSAFVDGVSENYSKDVRPGISLDVQRAFKLTSGTSTVELEIQEAFSWSDDMVTMDFDPASLS